ncbi:MAG TPA: imidazole glycerol phosphate synthase subunit HisH, partial [Actinomycetota bacterium]|nr:imidazole glycerol phosphate synthase subunit HisH [Actinomycetota bacterium]
MIGVVDYGLGNLPSVTKALERAGADVALLETPDALHDELRAVVLPGVGHFGAGARNLRETGFDAALKDWVDADRPLLAICVGLQLLFERSEEDPDERGLAVVPGTVRRLRAPKVPHMGWNDLSVREGARVLSAVEPGEKAYFVHSFHVCPEPDHVAATTTYGETFCSAIERGSLVGVQFH